MLRSCLALCRTILMQPLRVPLLTMSTAAGPIGAAATRLPGDLLIREHTFKVPIDHLKPRSGELDLFVRELVPASKASDESLPCLMYLQGGPGLGRADKSSVWLASVGALDALPRAAPRPARHRPLDANHRAVARRAWRSSSSGVLPRVLPRRFHRQGLRDRSEKLAKGGKLSLIGQSFGGFCILSYLSQSPRGDRARAVHIRVGACWS